MVSINHVPVEPIKKEHQDLCLGATICVYVGKEPTDYRLLGVCE